MASQVIYRYALRVEDYPEVIMPRGAQVLSVAPGRSAEEIQIDLWALVDPTAPLGPRNFRIVGTGHTAPDDLGRFIGTVALLGGSFIGHVFEVAA